MDADIEIDPLAKAHEYLARSLGLDPKDIKMISADWGSLMKSGVLVKMHVSRWRAKAQLDLSDLGLYDQDGDSDLDDLIRLGEKLLAPPDLLKQLDSVEQQARDLPKKFGFQTYWGVFIPATAYEAWKAEDAIKKASYFALREKMIDNWEANIDQMMITYRRAAQNAYRRAKALTPEAMTLDERLDENIFVNRFLGRLIDKLPSKAQVHGSFAYKAELSFIPLPDLIAEQTAQATIYYEQAETARAEERQKRRAISERSEAEARMMQDIINQAKAEKQEMIDGFMSDIAGQLRTMIYDATTEILANIERNGFLQPRSVVQLKGLIDRLNMLNFYGDSDIDRMIGKLKGIIDQDTDARQQSVKAGQTQAALADIATVTRATLLSLGQSPRSPKGTTLARLGIDESPAPDLVRSARSRLQMIAADPAQQDQPTVDISRRPRLG